VIRAALAVAALVLVGCTDDTDPPWQLSHDRIIAIRATPAHVAAGEQAVIDGLTGSHGAPVAVASPETVTVVSPAGFTDAVSHTADGWVVTAPSDDRLATMRGELQLSTGAPVPLVIEAAYRGGALRATKTVWLGGAEADNPAFPAIAIHGAPAPAEGSEIVIPALVDVPLAVALSDVDFDVNWLTSCGTMHDFDLPSGFVHIEADDPHTGQLVLVVRDAAGGVSWRIWPMRADAAPASP
jgi:hypothetical protein